MKQAHQLIEKLGLQIKSLREAKGWSQAELAKRAGISDGAVKMIESGRRWPRPVTMEALGRALGLKLGDSFAAGHRDLTSAEPDVRGAASSAAMVQTIAALQAEVEALRNEVSDLRRRLRQVAKREFPGVPLEIVQGLFDYRGRWNAIARLLGVKKRKRSTQTSASA